MLVNNRAVGYYEEEWRIGRKKEKESYIGKKAFEKETHEESSCLMRILLKFLPRGVCDITYSFPVCTISIKPSILLLLLG